MEVILLKEIVKGKMGEGTRENPEEFQHLMFK